MLPKTAYLLERTDRHERRGARRRAVRFEAEAASVSGGTRVLLIDLSETGLRMMTGADLEVGDLLDFAFPEAGDVTARVVRQKGHHEYGAHFLAPIPTAAVSATLLAAPIRAPTAVADRVTSADHAARPVGSPRWLVEAVLVATLLSITVFVLAIGFLPIAR